MTITDSRSGESSAAETAWPPPGLESLHGALLVVRSRATLATLLIAPGLVWLLAGLPVMDRPIRGAIGIFITVGLFVFLTAILNAARVLDTARRARKLGYRPGILLEVAVDRSRDTAALVAGTGSYESVRERTRRRVRQLRVLARVSGIAAAVLPLPLICIAVALALRGAADGLAVAMIPLLPAFFLALTSGITAGYAAILAQWDRGSDAWDPSPVTVSEKAAAWRSALAEPESNRRTSGGLLLVLAGAAFGVVLFISVAFALAVITGYGMYVRELVLRSTYQGEYLTSGSDLLNVELMRDFRLKPDSSISREQAGAALHALLYAGADTTMPGRKQPERLYAQPLWPARRSGGADWYWSTEYFRRALDPTRGTSSSARPPGFVAMDSIADAGVHPAMRELALLARATDIDVTATRYTLPLTDNALRSESAYPASGFDVSARVMVTAARKFRQGDVAGAEADLLTLLSAGFLLIDRSPFGSDFATGSEWIGAARRALTNLYNATGRTVQAEGIARVRNAQSRAYSGAGGDGSAAYGFNRALRGMGGADPLRELLGSIRNTQVYPALRWTAFQAVVPLARCGTLRSAAFGPDAYTTLLLDNSRNYLTRIPSDSALAAIVMTPQVTQGSLPFALSRRPGFRRLQRAVLLVIGKHQFDGPCAGAFTARF